MQGILNIHDYNFLNDAYYGRGGFRDGSYLVSHPREAADKFLKRKELSYYLNYVAPVVNSHVNPVFRKEPEREWSNNELFSAFIKDVDKASTKLSRFMKRAALMAKLQGVAFIVVDNESEQPQTLADAHAKRAFPYIYLGFNSL